MYVSCFKWESSCTIERVLYNMVEILYMREVPYVEEVLYVEEVPYVEEVLYMWLRSCMCMGEVR